MSYRFVEKQVLVNGCNICYLEGGATTNAEPILFLHGWGVGVDPYQEVLNVLCDRYHVFAPYLPGFGKSSGSVEDWGYEDYALLIEDFLKELNINKIHLVGHSFGGGVCAVVAAFAPDRVKSLVLVASTGIPVEPPLLVLAQRVFEMTAQTPHMRFPQIIQVFQAFS